MLELMAPPETVEEARKIVEEKDVFGVWTDELKDGYSVMRVLVDVNRTESLSDVLADKFSHVDGFRILLFEVQATLPQPDIEEVEEETSDKESSENIGRISREELYAEVTSGSELTWVYLSMVMLSSVVAGVGLIRGDVAVIIGAMVIAPLLGPNVSMALSVTLGDLDLGWRSLKASLAGLFSSLLVAFVMGLIMYVDVGSEELIDRTTVGWGDLAIAMSAGSAGVLAFTRGIPATIVGVMVAVALLPPWVNVGLLLGAGYTNLAIGSFMLTVNNLVCINLAGILTFLIQGIRPRNWWEAEKAKKSTRKAIAIWFILLVILSIIMWLWDLSEKAI